jgi:hypothetical protein
VRTIIKWGKNKEMNLCDYGCGEEGKFQFKNGKWCCSEYFKQCPEMRKRMSKKMTGRCDRENHPLYGRCLSEETRKKISAGNLGKIRSPEVIKNMSERVKGDKHPFYGKKRPEHSKIMKGENNPNFGKDFSGINNPMFGKKHSSNAINKMMEAQKGDKHPFYGKKRPEHSKIMKGENNPSWLGGISCEPYCTQWTDKEYKDSIRLERDGGICQNFLCEGRSNKICLHHINYDKKDCRPLNLITLCISCNFKANHNRDWYKSFYNELIRRKYEK